MNGNIIIVYDYETASPDRETCQIIQIGAIAIDPRRLTKMDEFQLWIRPEKSAPGYTQETMEWHAKQRNISLKEMMEIAMAGVGIDTGWSMWSQWVDKFNRSNGTSKTPYMSPIAAGYNIRGFDMPITDRYCMKYGPTSKDKRTGRELPRLFNQVHIIDIMDHLWFWFENISIAKNGLKLTSMAEYMGYPGMGEGQAHDARFDVQMTAEIMLRLFKLQRYLTTPYETPDGIVKRRLEMKDCFKNDRGTNVDNGVNHQPRKAALAR